MSTAIQYGYDYVFDLASRLSPKEQRRLLRELPNGFSSIPKAEHESFLPESDDSPYSPEAFYEFLLQGPVIDEEQVRRMSDAREEVNRCRPISW